MAGKDDGASGSVSTARLAWSADDLPRSRDFDDAYHGAEDGLAECRHVFLDGNRLGVRWADLAPGDRFVIGETGFGTGLNFLAAWQRFLETAPGHSTLEYLSVERHPLARVDLARALARWPELENEAGKLLDAYPRCLAPGPHPLVLGAGRVRLTLVLGEAVAGLEQLLESTHPAHRRPRRGVDAWFLDGFAPARNPAMWRGTLLEMLRTWSAPGATFATFTAAGKVRRGLEAAGFAVRKAPGFGPKRHMLTGQLHCPEVLPAPDSFPSSPYPDGLGHAWAVNRDRTRAAPGDEVVVVGGGLAGCHAAHALAKRGLSVTLLEAEADLAQGGSGNGQGVLYARLSAHGDPAAQFNLAALMVAQRHFRRFWQDRTGDFGDASGVLHLASSDRDAAAQVELADHFGPNRLFRRLDRGEAGAVAGIDLPGGGLWFPDSGWLSPPAVCRRLAAHERIVLRQAQVRALRRNEPAGTWTLLDAADTVVATSRNVVLACALGLRHLDATVALPLQAVRGQVSRLTTDQAPAAAALRVALCGDGYVAPTRDGAFTFGASFVPGDECTTLRSEEHEDNLARLRAQAPGLVNADTIGEDCAGRAALRCASRDRLPLVGPVPDVGEMARRFALLGKNARAAIPCPGAFLPGLFVSAGYGSRGLAYIPLCTELLLSELCGSTPPLGRALRERLHPARFLIRDLCRGMPPAE